MWIVCMKLSGHDPAYYGPFDAKLEAEDWRDWARTQPVVCHANFLVFALNPPKELA